MPKQKFRSEDKMEVKIKVMQGHHLRWCKTTLLNSCTSIIVVITMYGWPIKLFAKHKNLGQRSKYYITKTEEKMKEPRRSPCQMIRNIATTTLIVVMNNILNQKLISEFKMTWSGSVKEKKSVWQIADSITWWMFLFLISHKIIKTM